MGVPISNVTRRVVYAASGTGPYNFTFEILANTDVAVYKDDTLLTLTSDYTVTINANGTGYITLTATPTGATQIAIVGNRTIQRTTDFVTGGDFFANTVNDEMDQQTIFAQQNAEAIDRALKAPQTDPTSINMTLPRVALRAGKTLAFDSNGNPVVGDTLGTNRGNWSASVLYYARDIVKDTSTGNIFQCLVQHTSSGSQPITTNADSAKWTLIVDNASAGASASAAAASASAASTSASNASTSASNAASSASTATTQASNASTSATNAANSASSAAASYDSFDDRYLGVKTSDPTLDNDSNALITGALYFNSSSNVMRVYNGSAWQDVAQGVSFPYTTFSGNGSTTAFTMSGTPGSLGSIEAFISGVRQTPGTDYTWSGGTTLTFTSAPPSGTNNIFVRWLTTQAINVPADGSVTPAKLSTGGPTWDASGNLGIGTSSPTANLHVSGTSGATASFISSASGQGNMQLSCTNASTTVTGYVGANAFFNNTWSLGTSTATPVVFVTNGSERARIDSSGNLLVGTTTAEGKLGISGIGGSAVASIFVRGFGDGIGYGAIFQLASGASGGTGRIDFRNTSGSGVGQIVISSSSVSYNTSSDYRLKENIQPMTGALAKVQALKPCTYKWKADGSEGEGFIAHELAEVVPQCVTGEKDAVDAEGKPVYQGIDTSFLVATLTAAIQEQQAIIEQLKADVAALKGQA